jgi:hypothetical protein
LLAKDALRARRKRNMSGHTFNEIFWVQKRTRLSCLE